MTREEAIKVLKMVDAHGLAYIAKNIAIEALEQQPCEDAISRQAVEDAIYDYSRSCDVNYAQIMEYIDKLPSVSTEKTGRWIYNGYYECSECGKTTYNDTYKYCPNCGAKMGVEE